MAVPPPESDRLLARRIARGEPEAVVAFRTTFDDVLSGGFSSMSETLAESQPPGCRKAFGDLVPHVAGASGESFIRQLPGRKTATSADETSASGPRKTPRRRGTRTLGEHVPALALPDLFLASACLAHDTAACLRLVDIVDNQVGPRLIRQFRNRLSDGRAQEVVANVMSQAWSVTSSHLGTPPFDDPPEDGAVPRTRVRLEKFLGLSTLKTWLYSMAYHMLIEETRGKQAPPVGDTGDERGRPPIVNPEPDPGTSVAIQELIARFRPRLQSELQEALQALPQHKSERHAQVAYLWLPCRTQQVLIASMYGVTKARVSQQASELTDYFTSAVARTCREFSEQTGIPLDRVTEILRMRLPEFFEPVLFPRMLEAFRSLRDDQPPLLQVAFLLWRQQRSPAEIAEQMELAQSRVVLLIQQLEQWRLQTRDRLARELAKLSTVPIEHLETRVDVAFDELFSGRDVSAELSMIAES